MTGRILAFPMTRLVIALTLFFALGQLGELAFAAALGYPASGVVGRMILALAALCSLLFVGRVVERRGLAELGFPRGNALRDLGLGLLIGAGLLSVVVGLMALAGWYRVVGFLWEGPGGRFAYVVVVGFLYYGLIAVVEEVMFRGVGFRLIEEWLGTWAALALSALLFGLLHLGNENATVWSSLAIAFECGVLFGAAYVLVRNLWLPIGLHWTWNYFEGIVYGTPVSGGQQPGLLQSVTVGPELWTGGAFGPEAGLIMLIVGGGLGMLALVLCHRQRKMLPPAWLRGREGHAEGPGGLVSGQPAPVEFGQRL